MRVLLTFRPRRLPDQHVDLPPGATVGDAMREAGQVVDATIAVRGTTPVAEDEPLVDGEELLLVSSFSGG